MLEWRTKSRIRIYFKLQPIGIVFNLDISLKKGSCKKHIEKDSLVDLIW
jgi:hypothetical protein